MARLSFAFLMMTLLLAVDLPAALAAEDLEALDAQTPIPSVAESPAVEAEHQKLTAAVKDCVSEVNTAFDAGEKERGAKLQVFQQSLQSYCDKKEYQTVQTLTQAFMQENYRQPRFKLMNECVSKKGITLPDSMRPDAGTQPDMYGSAICNRIPGATKMKPEEGAAQ